TIDFAEIPPQLATEPFALVAGGGSPEDPVHFEVLEGPASIDGENRLHFSDSGSVRVRATLPDNAYYEAAEPVERVVAVSKAPATIFLGDLTQTYDGLPRTPAVETVPAGLPVVLRFDGEAAAPTEAGTY